MYRYESMLESFDLATNRNQKEVIKLHTLLDYDCCSPSYLPHLSGLDGKGYLRF